MPRRDTMHRRSNRIFLPALLLVLSFVDWGLAQTATPSASASSASPQASSPQTAAPQQNPTQGGTSAPTAPQQAPPQAAPPAGANQSGPSQGVSNPGASNQTGQEPQQDQSKPAGQDQSIQPANDAGTFVFKKEVEEVMLHATVIDDRQRLVTTLDKKAFSVFENNQPQIITSFRHEDIPVAMGIVIDNSGSMREKRDKVNKAAINLVRSSNPNDQVFVVNFNDE